MSTQDEQPPKQGPERTPPPLPRAANPSRSFDPRIRAPKGVRGPRAFVVVMVIVAGLVSGIIYASVNFGAHGAPPTTPTNVTRPEPTGTPLSDRYVAKTGNTITVGGTTQPAAGATPNSTFTLRQGGAPLPTPTLAPGFSVSALTSAPAITKITPRDIIHAEANSDRTAVTRFTSGLGTPPPAPALVQAAASRPSAYVQVVGAPATASTTSNVDLTSAPARAPPLSTAAQQTVARTALSDQASETNPHSVTRPLSRYVVQAGTFIQARLLNGVTSMSGGALVGMVATNVYDSVTQHILLIPAGSKLLGTFAAGAVAGQNRIAVIWTRIIFPNGDSLLLNDFSGTSSSGAPALNAAVDNHTGALIVPALLLTLLQAGATLSQGGTPQTAYGTLGTQSPSQVLGQSLAQELDKLGTNITSAALAIAPTLSIQPAEPFNIEVASDMVFSKRYIPQGAAP